MTYFFYDLYGARIETNTSSAVAPEGEPRCWLRIRGGEMAEQGKWPSRAELGKPNNASAYLDVAQVKQLIAGLQRFVDENEDEAIQGVKAHAGRIVLDAYKAPTDGQSQDRLERLTAEKNQLLKQVEEQEAQLKALSQQAEPPAAPAAPDFDWWRDCWLPVYVGYVVQGYAPISAAHTAGEAVKRAKLGHPE